MAKISSPLTEIPIGKTEISVTEPGHPLIWTYRKSTGLIWRDPKLARPHWISCQKSIPFVCAQISGIATGQTLQLLKKKRLSLFFFFFKSESVYHLSRGEVKNAPWRENLDFLQLCFQQISELFPPRKFWRDLLLLDLSKGFLSELAQRCIERFVIFKRLGFHRKRVIIELCLDCVKQTTCCCSQKGWQQNSNRPHSQWCVGHLSHITPYPSYLSCALCILLEQDNTSTSSRSTNAIAWMCASIELSKKFTWCLSCQSDTYSSSFLLLATVR